MQANPKNSVSQDENTKNGDNSLSFLDRIEKIAAGRTLTPWLKSIGWVSNDVTRIREGHRPGTDKLEQLARAESVSITWLLTGQGAPYVVEFCPMSSLAVSRLTQLAESTRVLRAIRVNAGHRNLLLLVLERDDAFVAMAGMIDDPVLDLARSLTPCYQEIEVGLRTYALAASGHLGRFALLDESIGLFGPYSEGHESQRLSPSYRAAERDPRQELHLLVAKLPPGQCDALLKLLESFTPR